jgi:hypothetical protein
MWSGTSRSPISDEAQASRLLARMEDLGLPMTRLIGT